MPAIRRRNIARRQRREMVRDSVRNSRIHRNFVDRNQSAYRLAWSLPLECEVFSLGPLSLNCRFCHAYHFLLEVTDKDDTAFTLCCHKGKVKIPPIRPSPFIQTLLENVTSNDNILKNRSLNYLRNIRSFNSAFAMVSSEAHLDENITGGIYNFKIHDVFYHRVGSLIPHSNESPRYAQVYMYDVDTAVHQRMKIGSNSNCDPNLMREISLHLEEVNCYVRSFHAMRDLQRDNESNTEFCMFITTDKNTDLRRYNDALLTDVAAIFRAEDGAPPGERNLLVFSKSNEIRHVSVLEPSLDPLAYPLLFPNGESGWHPNMEHATGPSKKYCKITMLQYASYRLAIRDNFSVLHRSQKLYLQWIVDMYVRIEGTRLEFLRHNQSKLRADLYLNIADFVHQHADRENTRIGRQIILPSSFIGSPRNMHQNYLDAMAIVRKYGKPSLFITMTCNPRWPEIINNLLPGERAHFRPDLVVRVFHCKLKELKNCIMKQHIFGKVAAMIYTIEFQKRGLPHAHILLTLKPDDKITDITEIDSVVSAEIPDKEQFPSLHEKVKNHLIHGPCGVLNPNAICMVDGKCRKNFPKDFNETTKENVNGYAVYQRRDNGVAVEVRGHSVDNRYVVPYNPYLIAKFDCHINVEVCSTVKSIKYIYKYVYKGYDSAILQFARNDRNELFYDEIDSFLSGRYVGSTEAAWRIFEFEMHYQTHTIIRLDCHLPNQQTIYFMDGNEEQAIANPKDTMLEAFFDLNRNDYSAHRFLYTEIPEEYVWDKSIKKWKIRKTGREKIISRMYSVNPKQAELFHLRMLLLHVRGPTCFEEVRTYNNIVYPTFVEAAHARGIASNNNEWRETFNEAKETHSPYKLRQLFGFICGINFPSNASSLWDEFKFFLCEDYLQTFNENESYNRGLLEIEEILNSHSTSCKEQCLPIPIALSKTRNTYNVLEQETEFLKMYCIANEEQRNIIDEIIASATNHSTKSKVYCLTALAGCGKTFVLKALLAKMRSLQLHCIPCAFSGIAASLLDGGRTLHNQFKLPIPLMENSVSGVKAGTDIAFSIQKSSLIIIDEISACPLAALNTIDRLLRDLASKEGEQILFGGKTVLLCGDFRQTLAVTPYAGRATIVEGCVKSFKYWSLIKQLTLEKNMRALESEIEFASFLKQIGDKTLPIHKNLGADIIEIPTKLIGNEEIGIISSVYGNINKNILSSGITDIAILAPKNEDCHKINIDIIEMLPGSYAEYFSFDEVVSDDEHVANQFPMEFLNSLQVSGLPSHRLRLKQNTIVMLIRNLNTTKSIINGTRMRVKQLHRNSIDCEVLTGASSGTRILIPRIKMRPSEKLLPFVMQRTQFPLIPAFAMTINKAQGQSIGKVGIYLPKPIFAHGQLYVAASRARSFDGLRFFISDTVEQGHLNKDNRVYTKNIVYKEIL